MHFTAIFKSTFPNVWTFDEFGSPHVPGGHQLAETIAAKLITRLRDVTPVEQHEYFGWEFTASTDRASFYNVLNSADDYCYLTATMNWYGLKALLLKRPRADFEQYRELLTDVLHAIPEVSAVKWNASS
jgi:hypothetical protein